MSFENFPQAQIISVEYEHRRYFNWFVVKFRRHFSVATKEEDAYVALDSNFVHDGRLSDRVTIPPHLRLELSLSWTKKACLLPADLPLPCLRYIHSMSKQPRA